MVVGGGGEWRWRLVAAVGDNGGEWVAAAAMAVWVRWWRVAAMAAVMSGGGGGGLWRRWWVVVLLMNGARGDGMEKKHGGWKE